MITSQLGTLLQGDKVLNNSNFKLFVILTLIIIATIFLIQNTQVVNINLLLWTYSISVSLAIVSMLIIGILVGWFLKSYFAHKKKRLSKKDEPKIQS